jgi:hypothetical protein
MDCAETKKKACCRVTHISTGHSNQPIALKANLLGYAGRWGAVVVDTGHTESSTGERLRKMLSIVGRGTKLALFLTV